MKTLRPGTISHGTLRPQDVVPALWWALQSVDSALATKWADEVDGIGANEDMSDREYEKAHEVWLELEDALQAYVPEGYFAPLRLSKRYPEE
jgi:hypothetical protein